MCRIKSIIKMHACQAGAPSSPCCPFFAPSVTKMLVTRNNMPAASVYLLENLHFSQFFVADSVQGCVNIGVRR